MDKVWVIGTGPMAMAYIDALKELGTDFTIIGRGEESSNLCAEKTSCKVVSGGIDKYLQYSPDIPSSAIIAIDVDGLASVTKLLLNYGVKNILVEKPGALEKAHLKEISEMATDRNSNVIIAYNRRYFAAVLKAQELIAKDGGVTSFNFEFTEWVHLIENNAMSHEVKNKWFLSNSTHVADLAFYLGGKPEEICCFTAGKLHWHPTSNFAGAGRSSTGALFNYQANWESAGRWSVEMLSENYRFIFRPMEKLQIQKRASVAIEFVDIDESLDIKFKPGVYLQTADFLNKKFESMCSIDEQLEMYDIYQKMAGY